MRWVFSQTTGIGSIGTLLNSNRIAIKRTRGPSSTPLCGIEEGGPQEGLIPSGLPAVDDDP